jgi:hypothetical protein
MNVVNQLVGPEVFNELDRQMRANHRAASWERVSGSGKAPHGRR